MAEESFKEIENQITTLREQINYHNYKYHTFDTPEITDFEFDALFEELKSLESRNPNLITSDSLDTTNGLDSSREFLSD